MGLALALLALPLMVVVLVNLWPLAAIVSRGVAGPRADAGLSLLRVMVSAHTAHLIGTTVLQAAVSALAALILGFPLAWLLTCIDFRGRAAVQALVTVPFVMPTVVVGVVFFGVLGPGGPLAGLHLQGTLAAVVAAHAFFNLAVVVRIVGGAWSRIDPRQLEAARMLEESAWRRWQTVLLPALRPALTVAALIVFFFCSTSFGVLRVLGGSGVRTLETEIFYEAVTLARLDHASALALVQVLTILAVLAATARLRRVVPAPRSARTVPRPPTATQRWLMAFPLAVLAGLIVFPLVNLVLLAVRVRGRWSLEAFRMLGQPLSAGGPVPWESLVYSLRVALDATVIAVVLGTAAAVALDLLGPRARGIFGMVLTLPLGISAVTVGLGMIITIGALPRGIRDLPVWLPLAQAVLATPLVIRILYPALAGIPPRAREAAAMLGSGPVRVFLTLDLPLLGRQLASATGLAFILSLGEFGASSVLATTNRPTLPVVIGIAAGRAGEQATVAWAAAVVLLIVTIVVVAGVEWGRARWERMAAAQ